MSKETDLMGVGFSAGQASEVTKLEVATDDVTTPTLAQINTAFGTAAARGAGWMGYINDAGAGTSGDLCVSDGTNWFFLALTKAS